MNYFDSDMSKSTNTVVYLGTNKVRNEIETKRNEINENETKSTKTKRNENEIKRNQRNQRKQNEIRC